MYAMVLSISVSSARCEVRLKAGHLGFIMRSVPADQWLAACKKRNTTCDDFDFLATHFYTCSVDNLAA